MKDAAPQPVLLSAYKPPAYLIETTELWFKLDPEATRVRSRIAFRANPATQPGADLELDGEALKLISLALDASALSPTQYSLTQTGLSIPAEALPGPGFTLEAEVEIAPARNTALEGLYLSNGMYCTQCEAEGFRKITFYPDRPDVMAPFTVHIDSDLPVLLSNGNPMSETDFSRNPDGKPAFSARSWHDPHPKPAYLFALVAGDLLAHSDGFTTASGRAVDLNIWVRPGDEGKAGYAMDALKRSMLWDEEAYGREYDLDVFNIVAVDDFNMGAMENKGLNIFNSKFVLASPETATDRDYDFIEGIVAHEYFHNWTGNRITCRDWFQLCLKEGLTVFRDQQFSADMRSAPVKRIEEVLQLRARQFREDAGPLAHNVRPESYIEINNFYTATVYDKGAEVIRMLHTLIGPEAYSAALDLYFDRHDGQACTIEDWLTVFEDATGRDLGQFKLWYAQAGTPKLSVETRLADREVVLRLRQTVPATPRQPDKAPMVIPVRLGLLSPDGVELLSDTLVEMDDVELELRYDLAALAEAAGVAVPARVVPSLLRGFSAPVILDQALSFEDRICLLAFDTDPFNRWEAGRSLLREMILSRVMAKSFDTKAVIDALAQVLTDDALDPAFRALVFGLPSVDDLSQAMVDLGLVPDPWALHAARAAVMAEIGKELHAPLLACYRAMDAGPDYSPEAGPAGQRSLRNIALRLMTAGAGPEQARAHFAAARNMTDQLAAFACLINAGETEVAADFEAQWQDDRLVMDKWFMLQVAEAPPEEAVARAKALTEHPLFDWRNPNRFRSVIGGLTAGNPAGFHDPSGAGYAFLADWLVQLDGTNPQTAARMSTAFETWPRYDADRKALMRAALQRIAATEGLSRDLSEMVTRMLAA